MAFSQRLLLVQFAIQLISLVGRRVETHRLAVVAQLAWTAQGRLEGGADELAIFPGDSHLEPAAGAQPLHRPVRPCLWQGGQQLHETCVALEQHLRNPGRGAKVAINLEWRIAVEEVDRKSTRLN